MTSRRDPWVVVRACCRRAAVVTLAIVLAGPRPVEAQPRCVFLECGPAHTPNPTPAVAPAAPGLAPAFQPRRDSVLRPKARGEVCQEAGGFDYCATSVLAPQFGNTYGPGHLVDADLRTAWVEGKAGHGEGESVVVDLRGTREVIAVQIMNGYHKNEDLFLKNSRVREADIQFSNGSRELVSLEDAPGLQTLDFSGRSSEWVRVTIVSVYPGTKYKDTAITELRIVTRE